MMAFVDTLIFYGFFLRFKHIFFGCIICDRYLLDAKIDLLLRFPDLCKSIKYLSKILDFVCPKPTCVFLLITSEEEMVRRMAIKNEPFPDSPEIRARRYEQYALLSTSKEMIVINANESIGNIHKSILHNVMSQKG